MIGLLYKSKGLVEKLSPKSLDPILWSGSNLILNERTIGLENVKTLEFFYVAFRSLQPKCSSSDMIRYWLDVAVRYLRISLDYNRSSSFFLFQSLKRPMVINLKRVLLMLGNKRVNERLVTGSLIDAAMESNETG